MIDFRNKYNREEILDFLKSSFLKDFQKDVRVVDIPDQKNIHEAFSLGYSSELELSVFEFVHDGSTEKRVALTKEAFNVLRDSGNFKAIGIFHSKDTEDWRFSLMTATPTRNEKNKVKVILSNPKRYSFLLGPNAKVNTPTRFLITKGEIQNFEDLKERFSIEVVNKEFYKEISRLFIQLVGGTLGKGKNKEQYKALLKLPGVEDSSQTAQEFAVRLIGRIIFCWFLREKRNGSKESLMPHSLLSLVASKNHKNYYHDVLEPIFFKILNVPLTSRNDERFTSNPYDKIPYLNGGLFSPHDDDFYSSTNESKQKSNNENVIVPDKWLQELFEILETYNFTIDENSAFDEELSIDPEMLGRIFENLLAEINPETGESARKSTGSYYTPRVIVDYMVDESLYLYLKNKTDIEEGKLRSLISYDLDDDSYTPLTEGEKEKIITTIDELKILDPACGSGAFPMGALQKIVFILQQLDPNGQYWFKAQIKNVPVELRKNLEREHSEKNFDYIRKLGVIRRNIFGVDIQPIATEISRLRCFLTLIVDQKVDDNKENRGIDPLPNLDFKFVTANSLVPLPTIEKKDKKVGGIGMFEGTEKINDLKEIRDQFFTATSFDRNQLRLDFKNVQLEMYKYYNSIRNASADLTEMLLNWDPFGHKTTEWFNSEWMFGIKNGFDIVIGNPPYGNILKDETKDKIKSIYKFSTLSDISSPFIEMATKNINECGILNYIITYAITFNKSFSKTRQLIDENFNNSIILSFDRDRCAVFKSMTQSVSIITANKASEIKDQGIFTSKMYRMTPSLKDIEVSNTKGLLLPCGGRFGQNHRLPKIGSVTNRRLLESLYQREDKVKEILLESGDIIWIRTSGNYWYNAFDFQPYKSSEIKKFYVSKKYKNILLLIINSSLFYFWMRMYGDGRHLNLDILKDFPLPEEKYILEYNTQMEELCRDFFVNLNSVFDEVNNRFNSSEIKSEIDRIDFFLAKYMYKIHYKDLLEILNYDKEVRGGIINLLEVSEEKFNSFS